MFEVIVFQHLFQVNFTGQGFFFLPMINLAFLADIVYFFADYSESTSWFHSDIRKFLAKNLGTMFVKPQNIQVKSVFL